jgi:EpsI family protein
MVDLCIAGFIRQGEGRELVGFAQGVLDPDSDWRWGQNLPPIGAGKAARIVDGTQVRDTLTVYMVDGTVTASSAKVKALTLQARLTGGDERAYAFVLSAQPATGEGGRDRLARFVDDAGGLETMVARLTAER